VRLHVDVTDPWHLMSVADLAVGAAGTTSLERCCLGLPSVVLVTAENQWVQAITLRRDRLALVTDNEPLAIKSALERLAYDSSLRSALSTRCAALCNGAGSMQVIGAIGAMVTA
jgi:UDP-2,4-diacetamido-2,4,6-trideoxy-beta-L-altropyranose hydrolase